MASSDAPFDCSLRRNSSYLDRPVRWARASWSCALCQAMTELSVPSSSQRNGSSYLGFIGFQCVRPNGAHALGDNVGNHRAVVFAGKDPRRDTERRIPAQQQRLGHQNGRTDNAPSRQAQLADLEFARAEKYLRTQVG